MFINFITVNPNDLLTTQAVGEEGGGQPDITTKAVGEEGGGATTLALNEEGGGNPDITTLALNEEGGGVSLDVFSTQRALNVNRAADANKDGQTTKAELDALIKSQEDQLAKIKSGEIKFIADPTRQLREMERNIQSAKFLQANFDKIAAVDGTSGSLSASDIRQTANRDFRPERLTQNDVSLLNQSNGGFQIREWILFILQWFQQFLGGFGGFARF